MKAKTKKSKQTLSVKMKCKECGSTVYHDLVPGTKNTYRCSVCGHTVIKK
jgi:uncharacterized Zn finger protein